MALTTICKKTYPYTISEIWKLAGVGMAKKPVEPMRQEHYGREPSPEQVERFQNRPGFVPWPWQEKKKRKPQSAVDAAKE